jgi:hypothetical protein
VSRFHGVHLAAGAKAVRSEYSTSMPLKVTATAVVNTGVKQYVLNPKRVSWISKTL